MQEQSQMVNWRTAFWLLFALVAFSIISFFAYAEFRIADASYLKKRTEYAESRVRVLSALLPALCGSVSHDRVVAAVDKSGIASTTIGASDNELIATSLPFVFNQTGKLIEIKE